MAKQAAPVAIAIAVIAAVGYGVWRLLGRGTWRATRLVDADGEAVEAPSGDAQADAWAAHLGISPSWSRRNIDRLEEEAYDAGAPLDWSQRGWQTPLGPPAERYRHAGPAFRSAPRGAA